LAESNEYVERQDHGAGLMHEAAPLDQIEESVTSSIDLRGHGVEHNMSAVQYKTTKNHDTNDMEINFELRDDAKAGRDVSVLLSKLTRPKGHVEARAHQQLRQTAPTNIVVSKFNTATGGVSTFRQSPGRSLAKKKDTQRTVELAPGTLRQRRDSLTVHAPMPARIMGQAMGKGVRPSGGLGRPDRKERAQPGPPGGGSLLGVDSAPPTSPGDVDQSIRIPGNPTANPLFGSARPNAGGTQVVAQRIVRASRRTHVSLSVSSFPAKNAMYAGRGHTAG